MQLAIEIGNPCIDTADCSNRWPKVRAFLRIGEVEVPVKARKSG
jgi:hypothetical protein